jgi:hypothetical protein
MFGQRLIKENFRLFLIEIWLFILLALLMSLLSILLPKSFSHVISSILVFVWLILIIKIELSWHKRLKKIAIEEDHE